MPAIIGQTQTVYSVSGALTKARLAFPSAALGVTALGVQTADFTANTLNGTWFMDTPPATFAVTDALITTTFLSAMPISDITSGSPIVWDCAFHSVNLTFTPTTNVAISAPTNPANGMRRFIQCRQPAAGSKVLTWNAVFLFPVHLSSVASTTANAVDYWEFQYDSTLVKWVCVWNSIQDAPSLPTVYVAGDVLHATGTGVVGRLADVATGNALLSGGVGVVPLWDKVGLTTHVSGVLPEANGGTGNSSRVLINSAPAVVLDWENQLLSGVWSVDDTSWYGGAMPVNVNFLLNQPVSDQSSASSFAPDMVLGLVIQVSLTASISLNAPTNAQNGQYRWLRFSQDATGGRTVTFNAIYRFPAGMSATLSTSPNADDYFLFCYNATDSKWDCVLSRIFDAVAYPQAFAAGDRIIATAANTLAVLPQSVNLTDAATVTWNWNQAAHFIVPITASRTLGACTSVAPNGTIRTFDIVPTGAFTLTPATGSAESVAYGTDVTSAIVLAQTATNGKTDTLTLQYNAAMARWLAKGFVKGY